MVLPFFNSILLHKKLVATMAVREVKAKYVGSTLGAVWTFLPSLVLIFVFWVVFSVGFKAMPQNNVPFVVWLTAGMTSWFAFSDMISGATSSITENGNLIKKTIFPSQILPLVKICSALVTHSCFLLILLILLFLNGLPLSIYFFQFFYYLCCLLLLACGLGWLFSSFNVFIRDTSQAVGLLLQVGFWATPIFWDLQIMPQRLQWIFKLNPLFYIVQGYRDSFIYFIPVWERPLLSMYFWTVTLALFSFGAYFFNRLRPQFADVL